ncbi:hypothetical protein GCM10010219_23010 [Streptomyces netropsis]|nr:hypothetical protein GCM10010219_23010 [Streptomyces netropsis]
MFDGVREGFLVTAHRREVDEPRRQGARVEGQVKCGMVHAATLTLAVVFEEARGDFGHFGKGTRKAWDRERRGPAQSILMSLQ